MNQFLKILACTFALANPLCAAHGAPKDTLDVAAQPSKLAQRSPLFSVARADERLVAVGQHGHILVSDDGGRQWQQAAVPVSSDLTAVHFPTPMQGWAVGHDGVILHSTDGGLSWVKQLDGRQAARLIAGHYDKHEQKDSPAVVAIVNEAKRMLADGPDQPFLNVWFDNERTGYVIGAFNLILKTSDGGKSWVPMSELTDNPRGYHLYGISASGSDLYIAGELGLLLKLDRGSGRFVAAASAYKGTYFGILTKPGIALAYGMRGNAWRSDDSGKSWQKIDTGIQTGLNAGAILDDGRIALISQGGNVLISADEAKTFTPLTGIQAAPFFGIAPAGKGRLALVGLRGTSIEILK